MKNPESTKLELKKRKATNRIMLYGGLGCLVFVIILLILFLKMMDMIVKLLK